MKRFLTVLIVLQLSMAIVGFQSFDSALAQGDTGTTATPGGAAAPGAPTPVVLTQECTDALEKGKQKVPKVVDASNKDIVVLLTEGIESGGNGISCGKIIECLRTKESNNKKTADGNVMNALQSNYYQCVVSGKDGLGLLSNYASLVYRWIAGLVGVICILMIIISGIQITMGGLSQEEVSEAKDRIVRSLTGMVVIFLSAFILYTINPIFFT